MLRRLQAVLIILAAIGLIAASVLHRAPLAGATPRTAHFHSRIHLMIVNNGHAPRNVLGSGNLSYGGGAVQTSPTSYLIFWGSYWNTSAGSAIQTIITNYFHEMAGTAFEDILAQYYQQNQGNPPSLAYIQNTEAVGGVWTDTSDPSTDNSCGGPTVEDQSIQNEVRNAITTNNWPADSVNSTYFVFTPSPDYVNDGHGNCSEQNFCAYHGWSTAPNQASLAYAAMPYPLSHDACGVPSSPHHNQAADDLASLTSHEQSEAITDPQTSGGWRDAAGYEIGDKCRFDNSQVTLNGDTFELQGEYSNVANPRPDKVCTWSEPTALVGYALNNGHPASNVAVNLYQGKPYPLSAPAQSFAATRATTDAYGAYGLLLPKNAQSGQYYAGFGPNTGNQSDVGWWDTPALSVQQQGNCQGNSPCDNIYYPAPMEIGYNDASLQITASSGRTYTFTWNNYVDDTGNGNVTYGFQLAQFAFVKGKWYTKIFFQQQNIGTSSGSGTFTYTVTIPSSVPAGTYGWRPLFTADTGGGGPIAAPITLSQ